MDGEVNFRIDKDADHESKSSNGSGKRCADYPEWRDEEKGEYRHTNKSEK